MQEGQTPDNQTQNTQTQENRQPLSRKEKHAAERAKRLAMPPNYVDIAVTFLGAAYMVNATKTIVPNVLHGGDMVLLAFGLIIGLLVLMAGGSAGESIAKIWHKKGKTGPLYPVLTVFALHAIILAAFCLIYHNGFTAVWSNPTEVSLARLIPGFLIFSTLFLIAPYAGTIVTALALKKQDKTTLE